MTLLNSIQVRTWEIHTVSLLKRAIHTYIHVEENSNLKIVKTNNKYFKKIIQL